MMEFDEVVRREAAGQVLVGVDRTFARRFYTGVPLRQIEERTGEGPYFEKMVIYLAFFGGPLALLASLFLSIWILGWWSALLIPVAVVVWIGFHANSARGAARIHFTSLILISCVLALVFSGGPNRERWGLALTYTTALWLSRLLYASATSFLRAFALRNRLAWEWIQEHLIVREVH